MTRTEYLLAALNHGKYRIADWVFNVFMVTKGIEIENNTNPQDYDLGIQNNEYVYYLNHQWQSIPDSGPITEPLWRVEEGIEIPSQDDLALNWDEGFPLITRVGTLFINYYCIYSSLGKKLPYQQGKLSISNLEKKIAARLKDEDDKDLQPGDITAVEAKKFITACVNMAGFSAIANPSATPYTMVPTPGIQELRQKLLEKYKDQLHDPAILAVIEKELVAADRAFQAQDPEGGFYIADKAFKVSRKKLFMMGGLEQAEISNGKKVLVEKSLSEGWDIDKLPAMIDSLRDGSYNRGAMTALGGEAVKFLFRIFAATKITEEDCHSQVGIPITLTDENKALYDGNTIILPNKEQVLLTKENIYQYLNQPVMVRSTGFCKTGNANFCLTCCGHALKGSENALAAMASEVGSKMLDVFMAKMHGTALETVPWDYKATIS